MRVSDVNRCDNAILTAEGNAHFRDPALWLSCSISRVTLMPLWTVRTTLQPLATFLGSGEGGGGAERD